MIGTQASGQGHETSFAQLMAEWLGIPFDDVLLRTGDTDFVVMGSGSHSSRSMRLGGLLLGRATETVIARGKAVAARVLEAAESDITYGDGRFTVAGTDRALGLYEAAAAATEDEALSADAEITTMLPTFPNGCHVSEVEIDPETGDVVLVRHAGVDDVGRIINPLLVDGQTHGAIVQGVGQALSEDCVYDPASGQLLSGSFMDYAMPRADRLPSFVVANNEVPAPNNPLGIKGAGEGGTTGAPPAIINAVVDALSEFDVSHIDMPATPQKIWHALRAAGAPVDDSALDSTADPNHD